MGKNVKRAVIGGAAGVAVALGGAWYVLAGNVVDSTRAALERFNGKQHADGSSVKITYDGLERTMFPAIGVRLVNPAIEVNSPGIAPVAVAGSPVEPAAAPQPFHAAWKHAGSINIITDYLAHEYRLVNDGSGTGTIESGADKVALASAPAHSELTLTAKDRDAFTQWQTLDLGNDAAVKQALSQIGGAHIAAGPMKLTNATTNAVVLTQDEAKLDFTNTSDATKTKFDLAFLSKGSQVTKEYADLITHTMALLHLSTRPIDGSMPLAASRAGKQDIDIAMNVELPTSPAGQPTPSGDVHVTKFNIRNDFYTLQAPTDIVLHEDPKRRHATIKLDWQLTITPTGAQEMQVLLDDALPMLSPRLANAGKPADLAVLKQKLLDALPTVSTLGPITFALDVDASLPKEEAPTSGSQAADSKELLALNRFTFGHKRWGLEAKGEAHRDDTARGANISGTLTCKQCTTLTQDLYATAVAVEAVLAMVQPGMAAYPLHEAMLTQLNTTLGEIGKPGATTGDLDFVVTTPQPEDMRLNDKPIGEAIAKLMMVFMPQNPPPAAAEPATAKPAAPGI